MTAIVVTLAATLTVLSAWQRPDVLLYHRSSPHPLAPQVAYVGAREAIVLVALFRTAQNRHQCANLTRPQQLLLERSPCSKRRRQHSSWQRCWRSLSVTTTKRLVLRMIQATLAVMLRLQAMVMKQQQQR